MECLRFRKRDGNPAFAIVTGYGNRRPLPKVGTSRVGPRRCAARGGRGVVEPKTRRPLVKSCFEPRSRWLPVRQSAGDGGPASREAGCVKMEDTVACEIPVHAGEHIKRSKTPRRVGRCDTGAAYPTNRALRSIGV